MPTQSVSNSTISVSVITAIGFVISFASAYIAVVLKNVNSQIERLNDKIETLKEDIKHHREMHNEHYDRIHDIEKIQAVMKSEHDKNHGVDNGK
jgi:prefoldin subunit 5